MMLPAHVRQAIRQWYPRGYTYWYATLRTTLYWSRFSAILKRVPDTGRLVDVGCGYGLTVNLFSLARPQATSVGFDPDERRIAAATRTMRAGSSIDFFVADARTFAFQPGDTVTMIDVLHHIPRADHEEFLRSLARAIGPNGLLLIADIDDRPPWKYWLTYASDVILYPTSERCQFWSKQKMEALLSRTGWQITETARTDQRNIFSTILYSARPMSRKVL